MKKNLLMTTFRLFAGFMIVLVSGSAAFSQNLSAADVQTIIAQAVSTAVSMNQKVTVSVTDKEGHLLGTFQMTGASTNTLIRSVGRAGQGLENLTVPATAAAHSKAGTAAILSSGATRLRRARRPSSSRNISRPVSTIRPADRCMVFSFQHLRART